MLYAIEKTSRFSAPAPGTKLVGLSTDGPFRCDRCEYFKENSCGQDEVKTDPELQSLKLPNGRIAVRGAWCCNHFERD